MCESYISILIFGLLVATCSTVTKAEDNRVHKKRQIYREQVLPHAGGRIPDTAFETDRLFLNRLQKEGIAVPDGVVLEQRNPQVYPFQSKNSRNVFHVALSADGRYTSKAGQFIYNGVPTIETTYLYPQIHGHKTTLAQSMPAYPIYRQLQVYNQDLNQLKFQPKKKAQLLNTSAAFAKEPTKQYKTTSYQNFNLISVPAHYKAVTTESAPRFHEHNFQAYFDNDEKSYIPNYQPRETFNSFDDLFQPFQYFDSSSGSEQIYSKTPSIDLPVTGFGTDPAQLLY